MRVEIGLKFRCFFSRTFLTAERSVARTVVLVSPGCAAERAKSRPVSLQKGWKSAVVGGGVVTSARILLMEEVLPSRLWQPDRSWSRRDAAKACVAACVSMALQRWICLRANKFDLTFRKGSLRSLEAHGCMEKNKNINFHHPWIHICSNIFTITQDDNFGTVHHGFLHQDWGYFIVNLFHEGWARRMLHWQFCGGRVAGRCALNSEDKK